MVVSFKYYLLFKIYFFICLNLLLDSLLRRSDGVGLTEYLCSIHYRYLPQWFLNPYILYDVSLIIDLNALLESMIARVEDGGPLKYRCQTCGTTMTNRSKMKRHAEVHLDLSHACIVCQKQFKTRNSLSVHYSQTHRNQVMSPWATTWNETKWKLQMQQINSYLDPMLSLSLFCHWVVLPCTSPAQKDAMDPMWPKAWLQKSF